MKSKSDRIRTASNSILAINAGSSSIKFALYDFEGEPQRRLWGKVDRVGLSGTTLTFTDTIKGKQDSYTLTDAESADAVGFLIDWLTEHAYLDALGGIGHRVVHGMRYSESQLVTPALLDDLNRVSLYAPEHLPRAIKLIKCCVERFPRVDQVVCFDTAFHHTMSRVARQLPIPRRFDKMGIQRYGFHGLSCTFLMRELERTAGIQASKGRIIIAHLGNGSSLTAVYDGKSVDTSMGFTPTAGLPMGTRSGDMDPGVTWYLMEVERLTPQAFSRMINHESGLLGISEISSDMRELLACQVSDGRAAEAVEFFCYQTRKWIGAFAAVLGGLDTLIFSGGVGEKSPEIRSRICESLGFLSIELDQENNADNASVISVVSKPVKVRVIPTNEEIVIATDTYSILDGVRDSEKKQG